MHKKLLAIFFFCSLSALGADKPLQLRDALHQVVNYYNYSLVVSTFCAKKFEDMQIDIVESRNLWLGRNKQFGKIVFQLVKKNNIKQNLIRIIDDKLLANHPAVKALLSASDTRQKTRCFDLMVELDDQAADIPYKFPKCYKVIKNKSEETF